MIDKKYVESIIDNFNMYLDSVKDNIKDGNFDTSISNLNESMGCIAALQETVRQMKQNNHDLLNDVYNKFKSANYVKTIKF
jgi:hypothetical protein